MNRFILLMLLGYLISQQSCEAKLTMEEKLTQLRNKMRELNYKAVIIPSDDEHQSEYVAEHDMRREWISEFTGSAGTAVVTLDKAALWTDSRYYLQADQQLNSKYWMLMKSSEASTPRINAWLIEQLQSGDAVAQNAKLTSIDVWQSRTDELKTKGINLQDVVEDLVDLIWPSAERPLKPKSQIRIHDVIYAGKTWQEKVLEVKKRLQDESADMFVVTALDDVAWIFNMRASDIPYNPMFIAYGIIHNGDGNHELFIDDNRIDENLAQHLTGVDIREYSTIRNSIKAYSDQGKKIWISPVSSYAIYGAVSNKNNLVLKASPIRTLKARKNDVELKKLRECHLRDSVARVRHMHWLETELKNGAVITEKSAASKLEEIQREDLLYRDPSFEPISAVGSNAAIIHYSTLDGTDEKLSLNKVYLLDAGAQYEDCTTDVTRTHHFGPPTFKEKLAYTKVLQGSINLANAVFPPGVYGRELDEQARSSLWKSGLDYGHGTGHGIGYFLSVHEDPPSTSIGYSSVYDEPFAVGMIQSDEPGYYEDGLFGIRLETDIEVVKANTKYSFNKRQYLKFEPVTWVPFDNNLIDVCLLTNDEVDWLNKYNDDIREKVGPHLKNQNDKDYLWSKTNRFKYSHQYTFCKNYFPEQASSKFIFNSAQSTIGQVSIFRSLILFATSVLIFKIFN